MNRMKIPPICGFENLINELVNREKVSSQLKVRSDLETINSGFSCALHMHQPTVPAGKNGELISYLQYMFENISEGDNHNAESFAQCYKRLAVIIPNLINEGYDPKIMLDYSGNLLWGMQQMEREDILTSLKILTCDETIYHHVEWLGTFWSHAVASSTPAVDFKLQITAWQHHFSALFGENALRRVRGFSLPEMHLPNHPEVLYQLITALNECGYQWIMVQEHSVQNLDGSSLKEEQKYTPNILRAQSSYGENASIIALIKTQGADTKLVGQMQPYYEALSLRKRDIGQKSFPSLVLQIADGENGGVMMNEFPQAYIQACKKIGRRTCKSKTIAMNGSEYLDLIKISGINQENFPVIQALGQNKVWEKIVGPVTPTAIEKAIIELKDEDQSFSMNGVSWTNKISWENGYENILEPMSKLSFNFHKKFDHLITKEPSITKSNIYQEALLYLLVSQTSCFRYWGQGKWTEYAKTIIKKGEELLQSLEI